MNIVFAIMADGKRVGSTVAPDATVALKQAKAALTRKTPSKDDSTPDYQSVHVSPVDTDSHQQSSSFVARLLHTIAEVSNSRFVTETA